MKPEPLKDDNKLWDIIIDIKENKISIEEGIKKIKLLEKSAVEWFIENLRDDVNKTGAIILLKEAFEDVIKK